MRTTFSKRVWPNSAWLIGAAASRKTSASSVEKPSTIADAVPSSARSGSG